MLKSMKTIFLIRHGKSSLEGADRERGLAEEGQKQAEQLADILKDLDPEIKSLFSSPFNRAILTLKPFADKSQLTVKTNENLRERHLSDEPIEDIVKERQNMWADLDYKLPGGESGTESQQRGSTVIEGIVCEIDDGTSAAVMSHGNLIGLIIKKYKPKFGYDDWKSMTMPDIIRLDFGNDNVSVVHIGCPGIDSFKIS